MFRSLQAQILCILAILIAILVAQVVLSEDIRHELEIQQKLSQQSLLNVELVLQLERDVIDLQRNVLIYKETASDTSANKFSDLMKGVLENLSTIENAENIEAFGGNLPPLLTRMRTHLNDYQENFQSVIEGRSQRKVVFEEGIQHDFRILVEILGVPDHSSVSGGAAARAALYYLSLAKIQSLQYLNSPDYEHIEAFNLAMDEFESINLSDLDRENKIQQYTNNIRQDFQQLTQLTRGYVFLVNVVMTGSANEFLFLTKELRTQVSQQQELNSNLAKQASNHTMKRGQVITAVCVVLIVGTVMFLIFRVIMPVRDITEVFNTLAIGHEVDQIPAIDRKDEVGDLARAADVFHKKNLQTRILLEASQDLNARHQAMNMELERARNDAVLAAESKSMFLANMSHEIRTPMNGIIGLVDLTLKTELSLKQRDYLNKVAYSGDIMMGVINDILDYSKIEAGKLEIEYAPFNLSSVIDNMISAVYLKAEEKALSFRVSVLDDMPLQLEGDALRINQVLLNLCTNAVKFTNRGLIEVEFTYSKKTEDMPGYLRVSIQDSGIGMTQEQLERVFDSFTQADGSTSRKFGGTGLGLSIVKQLVALMDGDINVSSESGKGSRFDISFSVRANGGAALYESRSIIDVCYCAESDHYLLPKAVQDHVFSKVTRQKLIELGEKALGDGSIVIVEIASKEFIDDYIEEINQLQNKDIRLGFVLDMQPSMLKALVQERWSAPILQHPYSPAKLLSFINELRGVRGADSNGNVVVERNAKFSGRVLLVEDNHINQIVAGDMLEDFGVEFEVAENGRVAVDMLLGKHSYDLVLMDVQMPVMDGYAATKAIRQHGFGQLVICGLSANAMKQDVDNASDSGMNDYLTKPIEWHALEKVLRKYLPEKPLS